MSESTVEPQSGEGAAPGGLVHSLLLDGAGGARTWDWDRVRDWTAADGCLWLHFNFEDEEARQWLQDHSGLNDIAYSSLTNAETRPRALNRGDNLLLTLRGINMNPGEDPDDMVSLRIWTDGTRLISTRRRNLLSTNDVLEELYSGNGPRNAVELLVIWTERITERMTGTIENFEDRVMAIEERLLSGETSGIRIELATLRKQIISVRRYLSPQREAMNRLGAENLTWLDDLNRLRLREINDRLIRHIEDMDEVRDRAVLAQEELTSRIAEQMNARSYLFTVAAVIFLPLGFLTGLMGINVGGMPGVDNDAAFWIVVFLCGIVGLGLTLIFKMRRWV
ncbi:zinc transporter ZntB [Congregibacter litoralis]|uniref:Mg2+ and Co2+ transporter n=1 Tax=Congregibacter litoralis KT71 TaxID=314285 RepID=A4A365_9GAMM|nr:zinc transporter ZntB [Congregibacter litoralis]EAQ99138.1 Mg2+ and Co2+ transporter [Congregibacter litoralis KT71]